jgi:hypothetical protein
LFGRRLVGGWLEPRVLSILEVLDSAQRAKSISGAVAEIGVHHGKLFIGLNLLQREDEYSVAIDVFGSQELNIDGSGKGDLAVFRRNVQRWSSLSRVVIHEGDSTQLQASELRKLARADIRLFSIDGGHTESTVFSDMNLAEATLASGGVVLADDIFHEEWPEVVAGTFRYLNQGGQLVPFAIGFNKVFFSLPQHAEYYRSALREHFEVGHLVYVKMANFAGHEVLIIIPLSRQPTLNIKQPSLLVSRSRTARDMYHRVQEWRNQGH